MTDVLSSVKAFNAPPSCDRSTCDSDGIDLESEIVAKLSRKREYIFELPVDYKPRPVAGKKITARDGFKAIFALFRYRFARLS